MAVQKDSGFVVAENMNWNMEGVWRVKLLSLAAPRKDEQSDTLGRENRVFSRTPHTVGLIMLSAGL